MHNGLSVAYEERTEYDATVHIVDSVGPTVARDPLCGNQEVQAPIAGPLWLSQAVQQLAENDNRCLRCLQEAAAQMIEEYLGHLQSINQSLARIRRDLEAMDAR